MTFLKRHTGIILVLCLGFILRIGSILVDPFLHSWDERFHALVARNMMDDPWVPMLKKMIYADYNPYEWCCNHIWLHKPPLFMWQMALSMKIFGVSEWAMRLPSALMGTVMILMLYRIAILVTGKKRIALWAALLLALSNFHLYMIAGIRGMDHNDVAHGFYILAGFWAYAEYQRQHKWYWAVLAGIFAGAAILVKWLTGLLVFLGWGIQIAVSFIRKEQKRPPPFHFLLALIVCCIIFLPWQWYILTAFPDLARYEYEFNRRHITEVLENNGGEIWYYVEAFPFLLGSGMVLLLIPGIWVLYKDKTADRTLLNFFLIAIGFVFAFFSFVVQTKVMTYLFIIVPPALIFMASGYDLIRQKIPVRWGRYALAVTVVLLTLNPFRIAGYVSDENVLRRQRIANAGIYRNLSATLPPDTRIVMNVNSYEDVDVMFYNNHITAYHWHLDTATLDRLAEQKIRIAVFENHGNYRLPDYVFNYPYLYIIKKQLYSY